uniref:Uncharacterized protein n=1 Tax=Polytomella parva TaxID=51329 RepID=A0A7S0VB24_9CHLO|mmetsp:Transcript_34588/g.62296  ORF Transcript_34588/g.62296 Transcript_34588/m.62296 type:complete len:283 (+) Transcript_34588:188-1036(+)
MPNLAPENDVTAYTTAYPNANAALACAILFWILGIINLGATIKTRAWFVLFCTVSCVLEGVGYLYRRKMLYTPTMGTYIVSQCFLIITPILLALVDYVLVGKLLERGNFQEDPRLRSMRPRWIARIFTASDFFCLALQGGGSSLLVNSSPSQIKLGDTILRVGIFLQIGIFSLFAIFSILVYISPALKYRYNLAFRPIFTMLAITWSLMQIRNIYRAVEFLMGFHGYINAKEEFLYCFDFALIFITCMFFTFGHYGFYLEKSSNQVADIQPIAEDVEKSPRK